MNALPAQRPMPVPRALESLCPLRGVVITENDVILPRAIRLTTTQSKAAKGGGALKSFSFEAFFEMTTGCVFIKPGAFEYLNAHTVLDQSVAYMPQRNEQESFFFAYRDLAPCVFKSMTAWLCHLRYHVLLAVFMIEHPEIDVAAVRHALRRQPRAIMAAMSPPKPGRATPAAAAPAAAAEEGEEENDDGDEAAQPSSKSAGGELPLPAYRKHDTVLVIGGHTLTRGRKSGKDESVRVHAVSDDNDKTMSVHQYEEMFVRMAREAGIPTYEHKGTPRLYPVQKALGKTKARRIVDDDEDGDEEADEAAPHTTASTSDTSTTATARGRASVTTIASDAVVPPAKRQRKSRSAAAAAAGKSQRGGGVRIISTEEPSGDAALASNATPIVYRVMPAAADTPATPHLGATSTMSILDRLRPQIKVSAASTARLSPASGDAKALSVALLGGDAKRATSDGRVIFVPLPPIEGVVAANLASGVVTGKWSSESLRRLLNHQPHLIDETLRGFTSRAQQYLIVTCTYRGDDVRRMRAALTSADGNRAVCDGVARGWLQLVTHGAPPAALPYQAYAHAANAPLRYDAASPRVRRVGQQFMMPDQTMTASWGVQAVEPIAAGEPLGNYRGRLVRGGMVELSAEQTVYELAGFAVRDAEDAYSYTEELADGTERVLSARGPEYYDALMAFINCCGPDHPELVNCEWHEGTTQVRATRAIARGEMLCLDYGVKYYERMAAEHLPIGVPLGADEELPFPADQHRLAASHNVAREQFDFEPAALGAFSAPASPLHYMLDVPAPSAFVDSVSAPDDLGGLFGANVVDDVDYTKDAQQHFAALLQQQNVSTRPAVDDDVDALRFGYSALDNARLEAPTYDVRSFTAMSADELVAAFMVQHAPAPKKAAEQPALHSYWDTEFGPLPDEMAVF